MRRSKAGRRLVSLDVTGSVSSGARIAWWIQEVFKNVPGSARIFRRFANDLTHVSRHILRLEVGTERNTLQAAIEFQRAAKAKILNGRLNLWLL